MRTKTYDFIAVCERGCAPFVRRELELKGIPTQQVHEYDTCLIVNGLRKEDLIKAAYLCQTALRVGWFLGRTQVAIDYEESLLALELLFSELDFNSLFDKEASFVLKCTRQGSHEYNSVDIAMEAGKKLKGLINERCGYLPRVDIKTPDTEIHVHIDEEDCFVYLELTGKDLAKRPYKVFNNPHSMKGPVAASLLMASGWKPEDVLVDPFTSGGVIPIEAALFASLTSTQFYEKQLICFKHKEFTDLKHLLEAFDGQRRVLDPKQLIAFDAKMPNVMAAQKNAKIAGVDKFVSFSRTELDWLETKVDEQSVDRIICHPIERSKHVKEATAKKLQEELFRQADFCLSKQGTLTCLSHHPEELKVVAHKYSFKTKTEKLIHTGQLAVWVLVFVKLKK